MMSILMILMIIFTGKEIHQRINQVMIKMDGQKLLLGFQIRGC